MSEQGRRWIVKDGEGRIYGPFLTSKILRQIEKGYFSGGELIASYPGGKWIPISRAPEFFDKLLDALASEGLVSPAETRGADTGISEKGSQRSQKQSRGRVVREDSRDPSDPLVPPLPLENEPNRVAREFESGPEGGADIDRRDRPTDAGPVIELTDLQELRRREKAKFAKLPVLLISISVALVFLAVLLRPTAPEQRLRLLAPRKGQPELPLSQVREHFRRGLSAFEKDTFSSYLKAQTEFVQIVEGAPKNAEAFASLCLTYRELWPFTSQDPDDLRVFKQTMQEAKLLDPGGINGGLCEIAYLIAANRLREARGMTDNWLSVQSQSAVLYDFTAEFLLADQKYFEAASYAEKSHVLWPRWLKGYVQEARARTKQREFLPAMRLYKQVLSANPKHQAARVELALIELRNFNQSDKAFEMLKTALASNESLPREDEFAAYLGLAQIYEKRNQKSEALQHAKKAFALDSGNSMIRQMIVRLGGIDELKSRPQGGREILYRGDQYQRAGDCVAAQAEYKAAFEADAKNATAALKAAKCLWQLNQSAEAIEWLKKAIHADSKLIVAYVMLADYYSQRFDYLSAVKALQKIQRISPKNYEVYRGFALVELRRNSFEGAVNFAKKAISLYDADAETYIIMGKAQAGLGRFAEAQRFAQRAIELDETNIEAQSLYAKILVDLQGIDSALVYVDSLIARYDQIVDYRVTKGELLLKEERYSNAINALQEARSLDKANKKALLLIGKSYQALEQNREALHAFLLAAEMDPSDANPLFNAGLLYAEDQRTLKDAIRQFQRVLQINPRFPRTHYELGRAYLKQNAAEEALKEAEMERAINPGLADAYILAAESYYFLKQYSRCAAEYQRAVAKRAADTVIYVKMARCYRLSGAIDSALSLLTQAKVRESGNAEIYKELGATYHIQGQAEQALEAYGRYLALMPNAVDRVDVERQMRKIEAGDLSVDQ